MNVIRFLNRKTTWTNAELAWIKVCVGCVYLMLGTYFHHFFINYLPATWLLFSLTMPWTLYVWIKKMAANRQ